MTTPDTAPRSAPPETNAGRRNMHLLVQLRWIAVGGQLVTIAVVHGVMGIALPLAPLLVMPVMLAAINVASLPLIARRTAVTNSELTGALLFDVAALAWQLYHSGGITNPFASLFLLQIVIGAILLTPASSWAIVVATGIALLTLRIDSQPLPLPPPYRDNPMKLYLQGSLVCFALIAVLLVAVVTRVTKNLLQRDAALANIRQRAAEEDHIVRMGLLASGAAHELGTPLASLSVILGDWKRMPRLTGDVELQDDLREMEIAVKRCKAILSGILMSAGEARGVAPQVTTMRSFLDGIVAEWRAARQPETLAYADLFGADLPIVSDPALKQVIDNVIDNAAEVSPGWVSITARREEEMLVLEVADRGPGFAPEMLASFGQPYRSTKGRPGGGLGLFLLVNVLRTLGGEANAVNRGEGGALVRISLPLTALVYEDMGAA
ncbi:two-component system sensor histidine kinase RegB [Sphingomonas zeicaulis]